MKNVIKNWIYGLLVAAGAFLASCSTTDEQIDAVHYNRVLAPQGFTATKIESIGTTFTFAWTAMQNADYYILEIFEATEDDSVNPADYEGAPVIWSSETDLDSDEPLTKGPLNVDLTVDKSYFARIQGVSNDPYVEPSKWSYLEKVFSTSAVRSKLNPKVAARTETSITIEWDDADDKEDVTSVFVDLVVPVDGVETMKLPLSAEDIEACSTTVTGLESGTYYKLSLIFGKSCDRGTIPARTLTDTNGASTVSSVEEIMAAIGDDTDGKDVKLLVAYSETPYDFSDALTKDDGATNLQFGCNLYLYGEEDAEGNRPTIKGVVFVPTPTVKNIHLESLKFDGKHAKGARSRVVEFVDASAGAETENVEIVNCDVEGYSGGLLYLNSDNTVITNFLVDGVFASQINAGGGDFIDVRKSELKYTVVRNSTFDSCARGFFRLNSTQTSLLMENCTVNACVMNTDNYRFFDVRITDSNPSTEVKLLNSVFLNEDGGSDANKCQMVRIGGTQVAPYCENVYYYNYGEAWFPAAGAGKSIISGTDIVWDATTALNAENGCKALNEDPCASSITGKFYITNNELISKKIGDPRWWYTSQPVVERATQLEAVTEPTVWDFTDKTKYVTESVGATTIIENIRIYAPAEIVMSEGISFMKASSVSENGVPESSALEFVSSGIGSVKVTTLDGGLNASFTVVAAGDRYTLPADGKTHTVVLGDLTGENRIFVLAGSAVTVTKVEWTTDLTEDASKTALSAPKVSFAPASVIEGNEDNVDAVASWAAVENAADYVVTFNNGIAVETSELSYTVAASGVARLHVGDYEISVVARPVATSSKYAASEAGIAKFTVKEKPAAGAPVTLDWNFTDSGFDSYATAIGTSDNKLYDDTWNGLRILAGGDAIKMDTGGDTYTRGIRLGGKGSTTKRVLIFEAPQNGTISVVGSGTSGTIDTSAEGYAARNVVVTDSDGEHTLGNVNYGKSTPATVSGDVKAGTVYIYADNGINVYRITFTYIDGDADAPSGTVWNFKDPEWNDLYERVNAKGSDGLDGINETINGLTITSGSKKFRADTYTTNIGEYRYFQESGSGSTTAACFSFTATSSGKLSVLYSSTGSDAKTDRWCEISVNGVTENTKETIPTTPAQKDPATGEFYISVTEDTVVYIYGTGNALRFYELSYTGGVKMD